MTNTTDKYELELEKAAKDAEIVSSDKAHLLKYMRFVGATKDSMDHCTYYYCNDADGKYYSETDIARKMNAAIRKERISRFKRKYA